MSVRWRTDFENLTVEEIQEQINVRRHFIKFEAVGTLYPRIVEDEIEKLKMVYAERMLNPK